MGESGKGSDGGQLLDNNNSLVSIYHAVSYHCKHDVEQNLIHLQDVLKVMKP